jgi:hypothetical protein
MEQILINLVAGALGGNTAGKASSTFDLGTLENTIAGLIGGGVLGQIITFAWPAITASSQSGNPNVGSTFIADRPPVVDREHSIDVGVTGGIQQ